MFKKAFVPEVITISSSDDDCNEIKAEQKVAQFLDSRKSNVSPVLQTSSIKKGIPAKTSNVQVPLPTMPIKKEMDDDFAAEISKLLPSEIVVTSTKPNIRPASTPILNSVEISVVNTANEKVLKVDENSSQDICGNSLNGKHIVNGSHSLAVVCSKEGCNEKSEPGSKKDSMLAHLCLKRKSENSLGSHPSKRPCVEQVKTSANLDKQSKENSMSLADDPSCSSDVKDQPFASDIRDQPFATDIKDQPFATDIKDQPFTTDIKDQPFATDIKDQPFATDIKDQPFATDIKDQPFEQWRPSVSKKTTPHQLLQEFIDFITPKLDCSAGEVEQTLQVLRSCFAAATIEYLESENFSSHLSSITRSILKDKNNVFVYILELRKELRAHKRKKIQSVPATSQPVTIENAKDKTEKEIRRLEKFLEKLDRKIRKLQSREMSLDDLNDDDSAYLREDKLKKRFNKVFKLVCQLRKCSANAGRETHKKFRYQGTKYEEINKGVENLVNKKKSFPDYTDIYNLVTSANMQMSSKQVDALAEDVFADVGRELQKRRKTEDEYIMHSYLADESDTDPAERDAELRKRLTESFEKGEKKIQEVIDHFVTKQMECNEQAVDVPDGSSAPSDNDDDDEEDENDNGEDENDEEDDNDKASYEVLSSSDDDDNVKTPEMLLSVDNSSQNLTLTVNENTDLVVEPPKVTDNKTSELFDNPVELSVNTAAET